jgi:hypothetical protein
VQIGMMRSLWTSMLPGVGPFRGSESCSGIFGTTTQPPSIEEKTKDGCCW